MKICECALSLLSQCHLFRESISVVNSPNETHISIENKLLIIAWDPFGKQRTAKYYPYGLLCTYCHLDTVLRIQWNHGQYHSEWYCWASSLNYQPFEKQTNWAYLRIGIRRIRNGWLRLDFIFKIQRCVHWKHHKHQWGSIENNSSHLLCTFDTQISYYLLCMT